MGWFPLIALALALAMDAFAVAIVIAGSLHRVTGRHLFRLAFHFGLFQALMLATGWVLGDAASSHLTAADHWIAFALLAGVGAHMIGSATRDGPREDIADRTRGWGLVLLSVATSVDALAVGLSMALIHSTIVVPALVVGGVAASLTAVGVGLGGRIGMLWGRRVEVLGGWVLVAIGLRILWQHLLA